MNGDKFLRWAERRVPRDPREKYAEFDTELFQRRVMRILMKCFGLIGLCSFKIMLTTLSIVNTIYAHRKWLRLKYMSVNVNKYEKLVWKNQFG
jgi:hypothetical protein